MRRRARPEVARRDMVPEPLLAGACVEVWLRPGETLGDDSAGLGPELTAWRRYQDALHRWLASIGIGQGDHYGLVPEALRRVPRSPWSFERLAREDPEALARSLERRGLPPEWRPVSVSAEDFGPEWRAAVP